MTVVDPLRDGRGWAFTDEPEPVNGFRFLREAYLATEPGYRARVTVPVLWDRERGTIVNNESAEIIRMFNSEFSALAPETPDYCPAELRVEIDAVNERVYNDINNGVYRNGFAVTQQAYEEAFDKLFAALDWVEDRLRRRRYLCGAQLTEADWRLFPTLLRFDCVYFGHFKCNFRRIEDYPCLSNYLRELYQIPGIAELCNFRHIKEHYYRSHKSINPTCIVPSGPEMTLNQPHDRNRL